MSTASVLLVAAGVLLLLLVVASCLSRANRLDRLHVRADAARAALHAALERRAVVARAIATGSGDEHLYRTAMAAEKAPARDREEAENDLGRLLVRLDRGSLPVELADELAEAEHRVMLGRRVHNDAVRDILALRSRRFVRWLRLAGNAPAPSYFEITDGLGEEEAPAGAAPRPLRAGRVVLLDGDGKVLLLEALDPTRPGDPYWFTPGGSLEPGEDARAAAARELAAETGLRVPCERLEGPVWRRHAAFGFAGRDVVVDEEFFVAAGLLAAGSAATGSVAAGPVAAGPVASGTAGADGGGCAAGRGGPAESVDTYRAGDVTRACVLRHRWWTADELRTTEDAVYPRRLGDLLGSVRPGDWDGVTRSIS